MHAAVYRARMTEETFQILLDVMERHFAALSLPDPAVDPKITRAISFSELPSTRRILIEQCYQQDDSGNLIRQYSCEQIFDKCSNTREVKVSEIVRTGSERCLTNTWKTTLPVSGSLGNVGWHTGLFGQMINPIEPKPDDKMESMDVEEIHPKPLKGAFFQKIKQKKVPTLELNGLTLSTNERAEKPLIRASTFGIYSTGTGATVNTTKQPVMRSRSASPKKFTDRSPTIGLDNTETSNSHQTIIQKPDYTATKKKLRSLIPEEKVQPKKSRCSCSCSKLVFLLLLSFATMIFAILYDEDLMRNQRGLDIKNMSLELSRTVYGQDRAIEELTKDLQKSSGGINFVALIGGTGVGKSYTIGIVRKHFPHVDSVFEYSPPLDKAIHEAFSVLSRRHCNLIVLENLNTEDLRDVMIFVKFLRGQKDQYCVYTIAVFNPQKREDDFSSTLDLKRSVEEFSGVLIKNDLGDAKVIGFEELDDRSLDACIRKAAMENDVRITKEQFIDIRRRLITANSGCKGAYAKVQLLVNS